MIKAGSNSLAGLPLADRTIKGMAGYRDMVFGGWDLADETLDRCALRHGVIGDPREKHEPTLLNPSAEGRARRIEFLCRSIDIAAMLGSETVSFWAGVPKPDVAPEQAAAWLHEGVAAVCDYAAEKSVSVSLEPEPGMLVETVGDFATVAAQASFAPPCARHWSLPGDAGHRARSGSARPCRPARHGDCRGYEDRRSYAPALRRG